MPDPRETEVPLLFPFQGIDNSQGYDYQRPGTTQDGINVRTYESDQDRRRGGSRAGLTPFFGAGSTVQVNGLAVIQSLSCIVTASQSAIPQPLFTLSPASAYLSGHQFTTITGVGLTGATAVVFGGIPAMWFYVVNDTTIYCKMHAVPSAATVNVNITLADASVISAPFEFLHAPITGAFTLYTETTVANMVTGCLGPDQKIWSTSNPDPINSLSSGGTFTDYALSGTAYTNVQEVGPDGNIWSIDIVSQIGSTAKYIWKTVPGGSSTRYTLETSSAIRYWSIIPGPTGDGNMYVFASDNSDADGYIYRVTQAGVVTKSTIYTGKSILGAVIAPDRQAWGIGGDYVIRSVDFSTWPPTITDHARSGLSFNTYSVIMGNDYRVWSTNNSMGVYAFETTDPTNGSYYGTQFGSLTNYGQGCAGPDGQFWQIDTTNPAAAYLVVSDLTGAQTKLGPYNLSYSDVFNYAILIAGDDGALYCAGQGTTHGSMVKFLG